jgi:hypothetical protein
MNRAATYLVFPAVLAAAGLAVAAPVAWDGNGDSNNSGTWGTTAGNELNWAGDVNPGAGDVAQLLDVTTGTRTVTLANPATVQGLTITQSTTGAVNRLDLNAGLTLNTTTPFSVTAATGEPQSVVVNFNSASGIVLNQNASYSSTLAGTWNFQTAGAKLTNEISGNQYFGGNTFAKTFTGALNVAADATIGRSNGFGGGGGGADQNGAVTLTLSATSTTSISAGTLSFRNAGRSGGGATSVNNGGSLVVGTGAALAVVRDELFNNSSIGTASLAFINQSTGTTTQSGGLSFNVRGGNVSDVFNSSITNNGLWQLNGTASTITRNQLASHLGTFATPTFSNNASGTLRGNSTSDRLDYNGLLSSTRMTITSSGIVSPGAGHNGSLLSSVGELDLRDINLTFTGASDTLRLDVGGASEGEFDVLTLSGGDTAAGTLTLDPTAVTGTKLEVYFVNGYAPAPNTSWTVLNYGSVSGTFDLATNLAIFGASGFAADPANYSIAYGDDSATLTVVPEPASLSLLVLGGLALMRRRRG